MENYDKAADLYSGENVDSTSNQCKLKVAQYAAQMEQYVFSLFFILCYPYTAILYSTTSRFILLDLVTTYFERFSTVSANFDLLGKWGLKRSEI